jgi:hypothetical protein
MLQAMTKMRKPTARPAGEEIGKKLRAREIPAQVVTTSDELDRQMRSALDDVYEVLLQTDGSGEEAAWADVQLVNDLTH